VIGHHKCEPSQIVHLGSSANLEVTDSPAPEKGERCEDLKANCGSASICQAGFRPLVFPGAGEYLHFDQVMSRFGDFDDFDLRRTC
jgi:hypothetical protein